MSIPSDPQLLYRDIEVTADLWLELACREALASVDDGGGPFGAVVVRFDRNTGAVLGHWTGRNCVTTASDPTAHAEINAIRAACAELGTHDLGRIGDDDSYGVIYSSCEPCPMCYAAIRWARLVRLTFSATRFDAAAPGIGFSDQAIYAEMERKYSERDIVICRAVTPLAVEAFERWKNSPNRRY